MFAGAVTGLIESLLDVGIDGKGPFDSAQKVADVKRAEKPEAEEAIDLQIRKRLLQVKFGFPQCEAGAPGRLEP